MTSIQKLLKPGERVPDLFCWSQIGNRIAQRIVVLELDQRRHIALVELPDSDFHVLRQHEIEKRLLLVVKLCLDL